MAVDRPAMLDALHRYPDWPRPGTTFCDVRGILADPGLFAAAVDAVVETFTETGSDGADRAVHSVLGVEARGVALAAAVALRLGAGFVPVARAGRLPPSVEADEFALEYGSDLVAVPRRAVAEGQRVLVVDAVLATGATLEATARLVRRCGAELIGMAVLVELAGHKGRDRLGDVPFVAVVGEV